MSMTLGYVDVDPEIESVRTPPRFRPGRHCDRSDPGFSNPLAAFSHLFYSGAANAMRDLGDRQRSLMDPALVVASVEKLTMLDYLGAMNERIRERTHGGIPYRHDPSSPRPSPSKPLIPTAKCRWTGRAPGRPGRPLPTRSTSPGNRRVGAWA